MATQQRPTTRPYANLPSITAVLGLTITSWQLWDTRPARPATIGGGETISIRRWPRRRQPLVGERIMAASASAAAWARRKVMLERR